MNCKFKVIQLLLDWTKVWTSPLQHINIVVLKPFLCSIWPVFEMDVFLKHKSPKPQFNVTLQLVFAAFILPSTSTILLGPAA